MISVLNNAHGVSVSLHKKSKKLGMVSDVVMRRNLQSAKAKARGIIIQEVYSRPENPKFPRSNNLWISADTLHTKENGNPTFYIYNNDELAVHPFEWGSSSSWASKLDSYSGVEKYYPLYVAQGNFFGKKMAPRDFYKTWFTDIAAPLGAEILREVKKIL